MISRPMLSQQTTPTGSPLPPLEIKPGEVYYIEIDPSHVVGHEQHSRRPFVVMSRLLVNRRGNLIVAVPLTRTNADKTDHPPHRIRIPSQEITKDPLFKGNIHHSVALVDHVRSLDKTRFHVHNRIGVLSGTAVAAVGLGLSFLFDLR